MTNRVRPKLYEFFAGGGLAGLGLSAFDVCFANDLDRAKGESWRANHPRSGAFRLADVWELSAEDLPGRADLAWASSPCQDLSLAGARGGLAAPRSGAFWGFWRLMTALGAEGRAPSLIVIENVMGLLTSNGGADFETLCVALTDAGYAVGALEVDASLWLPQSRPRLFVVAARGGMDEALTLSDPRAPFHGVSLISAHAALPESVRRRWVWWRFQPPPRRNHDLSALLEPDDKVTWFTPEAARRQLDLMAPLHRARLNAALAAGERRVGAAYRRVRTEKGVKVQRLELRMDGLAGCLRTPAGGSSRQLVVVCEAGQARIRRLTGREAARLMGVSDSYVLPSGQTASLKLMGDAVAVPAVRALQDQILLPLLAREARRAA